MTIKEFIKKSRLKTWDVIIIAVLVLGSFLPLVVFAMQNRGQEAATYQAVLKVDNKVIKVFDLKRTARIIHINTKQKTVITT